ncbi:MAG TPA: hypothetical protein VHW65_01120 [Gemmatimonadales bacterium]|jgi:hypothetical protein|nr:hypothetical protein [Gemmatimonadales bacterium]
MTAAHLTMEQLLAVRDGDRSEAAYAEAHVHIAGCGVCQREIERLHQRTARLKALPMLMPVRDEFPVVRARLVNARRHRRQRFVAVAGLGLAASLVVALVGRDLIRPSRLAAEQQLQEEKTRSQQLEQTLHQFHPDQRVVDGRTVAVVLRLEGEIARLDAQLNDVVILDQHARVQRELALWRQRVGLMNALVDVHLTKASKVDL